MSVGSKVEYSVGSEVGKHLVAGCIDNGPEVKRSAEFIIFGIAEGDPNVVSTKSAIAVGSEIDDQFILTDCRMSEGIGRILASSSFLSCGMYRSGIRLSFFLHWGSV